MIRLRAMLLEDIPLFKKWLSMPHVAPWYSDAAEWVYEVEKQDGEFYWIHHFIVEYKGTPIGFCQYYALNDSGEPMGGYAALGGAYSIDYLIGEEEYLQKGFGKQIVRALTEKISLYPDAKRIAVQPDRENKASRALLLACGFHLDEEKDVYVKTL